jgi:3',5'-nucleoside bisphosphate phosphatase
MTRSTPASGGERVMSAWCDLHVHSTCSDGTVAPAEVVRRGRDAGLVAMALTDHDTFDGVAEALAAGARLGIRVVPGIELSLPHEGTFHMIGLGVDPADAAIRAVADLLNEGRGPRNRQIVAKLVELGVDVTIEEVEAEAGGDVVARPHVARVLVKKGVVGSMQEAFDRYLKKGAAAYADRPRVELSHAIAAIRGAGGASVLCHPFSLGFDDDASTSAELRRLAEAGLDAVEVRCGSSTRGDAGRWESLAKDAGLLPSGGSDFHGDNKPDLRIGTGRGKLRVPLAWLEALEDRAASRRAPATSSRP